MAILNITYNGLSADYPIELDGRVADADLKRIAHELVRSGDVPGLNLPHLPAQAFDGFVIDRLQGGNRLYLRPKVPFGA
jgi:hypothetical protein